jgi:hypothetical protein
MKVGLTGTISCGKTTLINELSKLPQFKDYHVATERSKYLRDLGIPLNTDSTLKGQTTFLSERCIELMNDNLLTDRTVIDVIAFTRSAKSLNIYEKEAFEEYASKLINEYDYIFYVSPEGVGIEDNGVRETNSEYRELIDFTIGRLCNRYDYRMKNFHTIKGTTEERIQQILSVLK